MLSVAPFLLLGVCISGGDDVVDVRAHKGLDLHVLLLLQHLLHHLDVAVLRVPHQDQVRCQALLHGTFGVLADPLEVRANLERKTTATLFVSVETLKNMKLGIKDTVHLWREMVLFLSTQYFC